MREKLTTPFIRIFLRIFLTLLIVCTLPLRRTDAAVGVEQVSLGDYHSAVLGKDGSLWLWGNNRNGQLGNNSFKNSADPVKIMTDVEQVSLGDEYSAALKKDGSLWLWGDNSFSKLGNRSTLHSKIPLQIITDVKQVSLGGNHSAALKRDGSLWMWGENYRNQLGLGDGIDRGAPLEVMTGVRQVSLGYEHSAVIKSDGSLWLWGNNGDGQLGNGGSGSSGNTPVMTGVQQVSLGEYHSAVVKNDGSLWLWGDNYYGQLGNGSTEDSNTPVKIMTDVRQVSLGANHSAALKKDGTLWLWGNNWNGQLGNGSSGYGTDSSTPVKIMSDVKQVSLGENHSAALKKDGTLWLWGANWDGQLGNGSITSSSTPVKITLPDSGAAKINLSKCKITLSKKEYTYTGKVIKPLPTIKYEGKKLKNKTDYTLTYQNNKKAGTATIVIKGKGKYTGQSKIKFTIRRGK